MKMIQKHVLKFLMRLCMKKKEKERNRKVLNQKIGFLTFQLNKMNQIQTSTEKTVITMTPSRIWNNCKKNTKDLQWRKMQRIYKLLTREETFLSKESIKLGQGLNSKMPMMTIGSENI